eukprot:131410-Prymnesium_polylepis.1
MPRLLVKDVRGNVLKETTLLVGGELDVQKQMEENHSRGEQRAQLGAAACCDRELLRRTGARLVLLLRLGLPPDTLCCAGVPGQDDRAARALTVGAFDRPARPARPQGRCRRERRS